MTAMLGLPRVRFELAACSFLRRTVDYTITDRHGAPLGAVRQRVGSAWRWVNRFFADWSTNPLATLDVLDRAEGVVFTIEKLRSRWDTIDAVLTTPDGATLGRVSSRGSRVRRAGAWFFDARGAPVASAQRTRGFDFVVRNGAGATLATVTKDVVTLFSMREGRGNLNAYEIEFASAADSLVRILTLATGLCFDLRHSN
ncbi:MAG: hypothetical protein ABI808_11885 [Pseudonocardiales bacterium]